MANLYFKFDLNDMQVRTGKNRGKSMIIDAPTGMGKTEAILNGTYSGSKVAFMLPTKTSAYFMYRRLEKDFDNIDLRIMTSTSQLHREVENPVISIEIFCPDGLGIDYLSSKYKYSEKEFNNKYDVFVLDEFDSYPEMVKTVMFEMMKDYSDKQWIIASATLESNFQELLPIHFERIIYKQDLDIIKFKSTFEHNTMNISFDSFRGKKVGWICNSIKDIKAALSMTVDYQWTQYLDELRENDRMVELHSGLTDAEIKRAEDKLFSGDFDFCIATDVISYSVDVNFDILITPITDNEGTFIQRLGRLNRYNKDVRDIKYSNLHVLSRYEDVPFINDYDAKQLYNTWLNDNLNMKGTYGDIHMEIPYSYVRDRKEQLVIKPLPEVKDILSYWDERIQDGFELGLRKTPVQFKLNVTIQMPIYKNGQLIETREVDTFKLMKWNKGGMPWAWYEYSTREKAEDNNPDVIYISGRFYIITGKDKDSFTVEEFIENSYTKCQNCNTIIREDEYNSGGYCKYCDDNYYDDWDDEIEDDDPVLTIKTPNGNIVHKGDFRKAFVYDNRELWLERNDSSISNRTRIFRIKNLDEMYGKWYICPEYIDTSDDGEYIDGIYHLEIEAEEITHEFMKTHKIYFTEKHTKYTSREVYLGLDENNEIYQV